MSDSVNTPSEMAKTIETIRKDKEKFEVILQKLFTTEDGMITDLVAELFFYLFLIEGSEILNEFDEIEERKKQMDKFARELDTLKIGNGFGDYWTRYGQITTGSPTITVKSTSQPNTKIWGSTSNVDMVSGNTVQMKEEDINANSSYTSNNLYSARLDALMSQPGYLDSLKSILKTDVS